jgi:hypothetical protein
VGVTLALLIPRFYTRRAKVGDGSEAVYIVHIGLKWLGYGFMASLSCTDYKSDIQDVMEELNG